MADKAFLFDSVVESVTFQTLTPHPVRLRRTTFSHKGRRDLEGVHCRGVVKTFLIDLPVLMLFGALFSLFAKGERGDVSVFSSSYFWHGVVFSTLFNSAVLYAAVKFPDWMWMYFLEDSRTGLVPLIYLFLFLYYFPYILGFYLGRIFASKGKSRWLGFALFLLGWEVWLIWKLFDRYSVVGTREEFLNGTAISLFSPQNPVGTAMNVSVGAMFVYYLFVWRSYRKKRKTCMDAEI